MTAPLERDEHLDPSQITAQAAALAEHLQRAGVHWIPQPSPENVVALRERMTVSPDNGRSQSPSTQEPVGDSADRSTTITSTVDSLTEKTQSDPSNRGGTPPKGEPASTPPSRLRTVEPLLAAEGPYPGSPLGEGERKDQLAQLEKLVTACHRCEILASCRSKTVFGEGSVTPRVAFFGEGPGADEDRTGRPFVGRAGQLLTKMIEACKLTRSDVYIFNTVKCRPPGNRNPEPEEINQCREYYQQQLSILRPEYIICLGAVSAQELLQSKLSVGRLRGKLHRYFESKVLVTYHPAYLLRNPSAKKAAWEDLQIMLRDAKIEY